MPESGPAPGGAEQFRDASRRAQDLMSGRVGEYMEIWEAATAKMMSGTYRSEDLVEDWFAWWGRAARDATAAATIGFTAMANSTEGDTGPTDED